ncbi:MAG: hypothetical protein EOO50_08480 [Flavobacterium sp.]|uniref:hypothetical protein n=1 Tax=Flavobacterium sp. TaxID=239 RepID=UPI00120A9128|nr:hypothetical protein [Flavobacterium sp.]RZJ66720.1 MAG: hypothetical protein EOO50_08480 [Flavobacterium sp.]
MKWKFAILFVLICVVSGLSQTQKPDRDCQLKLYSVDSLVKANEYDKAWIPWSELRKKCPTLDERIYTKGFEIVKFRIDRVPADQKERGVQELLKLYDDYNKYYPNNPVPIALYKAMAMDHYKVGTSDEIYALLDKAFKNPSNFKDVDALHLYLKLYVEKQKAGDKTITPKNILVRRDALATHLAKLTAESPGNAKANERYADTMDRLVSDFETCETLSQYYGEVFEARKKDTIWLGVASKKLLDKQCVRSPIFSKISEAQQNLKPTSQSAYNLGTMAFEAGKLEDAAKYFNQSADLSKDPSDKAATYFTIASMIYMQSDKAKTKEYAQKALEVQPNFAKSYILLAQLYADAGKDCAKNDFEKKALNWLAAETMKKAVSADPKMNALDKMVKKYNEKAPTSAEIKEAKMAGKTIAFGCWINETVDVPQL